jgi:hypothetical protein
MLKKSVLGNKLKDPGVYRKDFLGRRGGLCELSNLGPPGHKRIYSTATKPSTPFFVLKKTSSTITRELRKVQTYHLMKKKS